VKHSKKPKAKAKAKKKGNQAKSSRVSPGQGGIEIVDHPKRDLLGWSRR